MVCDACESSLLIHSRLALRLTNASAEIVDIAHLDHSDPTGRKAGRLSGMCELSRCSCDDPFQSDPALPARPTHAPLTGSTRERISDWHSGLSGEPRCFGKSDEPLGDFMFRMKNHYNTQFDRLYDKLAALANELVEE